MDNAYGDQQASDWHRSLSNSQPRHGHSHNLSGHMANYHGAPSLALGPGPSSSMGHIPAYPTSNHSSLIQSVNSHFPGPPVSSGPRHSLPASSLSGVCGHIPSPLPTQPDFEHTHQSLHMPPSPYEPSPPLTQQEPRTEGGQHGRRDILPCAPGRPTAPSPKTPTTASKDKDGKFPCQQCTKTYQHAKHLKRHMLRHTGARPYPCPLCSDTFARSDILKRHFQKCSQRRGNPSGATHLEGSRNLRKKERAAKAEEEGLTSPASAPANPYETPYSSHWSNAAPFSLQPFAGALPPLSAAHSRSNSVNFTPSDFSRESRQQSLVSVDAQSPIKFDYGGPREFNMSAPAGTEMEGGLSMYPLHQGQPYYEQRK